MSKQNTSIMMRIWSVRGHLTVELPQYDMTHDYYAEFWKTYLITHLQVSQLKQLSTAVSRIEEKIAEV